VYESGATALGRRAVTCANANGKLAGVKVRGEYVRKFGATPPCWPDSYVR
jgi:hypothetical protein